VQKRQETAHYTENVDCGYLHVLASNLWKILHRQSPDLATETQ